MIIESLWRILKYISDSLSVFKINSFNNVIYNNILHVSIYKTNDINLLTFIWIKILVDFFNNTILPIVVFDEKMS